MLNTILQGDRVEYFRVTNWEKYQHSDHKKSMPWIKLHTCLLEDDKFNFLDQTTQLFYVKLLLLAARTSNKIPAVGNYIGRRVGLGRGYNVARVLKKLEQFQMIEKIGAVEDLNRTCLDKIRENQTRAEARSGYVGDTDLPLSDAVLAAMKRAQIKQSQLRKKN